MKVLYETCICRAVKGSLYSPRNVSFSFALRIMEVVSDNSAAKGHPGWAVWRHSTQQHGLHNSRVLGYRSCSVLLRWRSHVVVYVLFAEHTGAMQCLCEAHHGKDSPSHREGLPSPLLHLCDVPSQPGWDPLHRGCWWEHPLHRGFP